MSSATLDNLERFTRLAFLRRRRALSDEERVELDGLMKHLCSGIAGFHPPTRRTRHKAESGGTGDMGSSAEFPVASAASLKTDPFEEKTDPLAGVGSSADLPANVQSIDLSRSKSAYTPKQQAVFLEDYYGADFVPDQTGELPKMIVDADGAPVPPTGDIQWFLRTGSLEPAPEAPHRPSEPEAAAPGPAAAPSPSPAATPEPEPRRSAAIVHLKAGGTLRGRPLTWPPERVLELEEAQGPRSVAREDVLAVFATGAEAVDLGPEIQVAVTLANDKVLKGRTKDYVKGAQAFTLVPLPKRPGVDVVWIPAHAVKGISRV